MLLAALLLWGPAASAAGPASAQKTAEQAIHTLNLQAKLPDITELPGKAAERAIREMGLQTDLPVEPERQDSWNFHLPKWVSWIAAVLGVAFLLYLFKDYIPILRGRGDGEWGDAEASGTPRQGRPAGHYQLAEALARDGRFVEAMHELLLQALGEIRARLGDRLADSLTSREVLRKAPLTEPGKAALREIIGRVEWTYFGEHPGQRTDYLVCRDSYDRLQAVLKDMPAT